MSGTSLDGLDTALLEVLGEQPDDLQWTVLAFTSHPWEPQQKEILEAALAGGTRDVARAHRALGGWSAHAVLELLERAGVAPTEVAAVGSHGQTLWHEPPAPATAPFSPGKAGKREAEEHGFTLQVGDPGVLAEITGIPVVSDFRSRDMAAGGHGAPLVPWPDRVFFSRPRISRVLQNLGGMGNLTWLPPRESSEPLVAFDTGPGVVLLDEAVRLATHGKQEMDRDGAGAFRGTVREAWVSRMLSLPFFRQPPPRSTGRELFGRALLREWLVQWDLTPGEEEGWDDLLASLTEVTARAAAQATQRWVRPRDVDEVVLTGGGARNPALVEAFRRHFRPIPVVTGSDALGMDPDAREAAAFALLAWAHLAGVCGNAPEATGARGPRVLGSMTPGATRESQGSSGVSQRVRGGASQGTVHDRTDEGWGPVE